MTPDSNPNNPDLPKKTRLPSKATLSSEGNIEFDFQSPKPGRFEKAIPTDSEMIHDLQSEEAGEAEEKRRSSALNRLSFAHQEKKFYRPEKTNEETSNTSKPMPTLSPSPSPTINDFRRNTDRQRREQKSVSTLISGVAYALIAGILLVGACAGFGGYVLYKQIQNQAVTVAQVDAKIDQQVAALKADQELLKKFAADQSAFDIEVKEKLTKLSSIGDKNSAALRDEKDARTKDVAAIIKRLSKVEGRRASLTPPGPGE